MRGCSSPKAAHLLYIYVFPAYAGMFLLSHLIPPILTSFPRVCGDVPDIDAHLVKEAGFSPRMRGCSSAALTGGTESSSFPRVCGDVPQASGGVLAASAVFPAYAGMFLV